MKKQKNQESMDAAHLKRAMTGVLVSAAIGACIGILMIILSRPEVVSMVLHITMLVIGVVIILVHLPGLITSALHIGENNALPTLILSAIGVVFGILLLINQGPIISALVALYLLIMPIVRLITACDRKAQLRAELPRLILGIVIAVLFPGTLADGAIGALCWIIRIAGIVCCAASVVYAIVGCVTLSKAARMSAKQHPDVIFADTTGDGKIDTVYYDDDRDGTVDRKTPYDREDDN